MNARSYTEPCAAKYFGFSQNDFEGYCTCARCKAVNDEEGSTAGTNIRFVNAVAEAVEREYPDKVIETLAYLYTRGSSRTCAPGGRSATRCTSGTT